ncbi:MAG: YfbK domain-containing protein [Chthoniobacter sp.]
MILATDGDWNVGVTNPKELFEMITKKAKSGVYLTVLGYGMDNLKDSMLVKLADKGNGNYGYIDTLIEAKKLLADELSSTLVTIAKDVKIQVEFNPAQVAAYRLIGYEKRLLAKEDFNDDTKDAGEIGAGHTVTALYEVVPAGGEVPTQFAKTDELKYQVPADKPAEVERRKVPAELGKEMLTLKLRYKAPDGDVSKLLEFPLTDTGATWEKSSQDFRFAAAVAGLRHAPPRLAAQGDCDVEFDPRTRGRGEGRRRDRLPHRVHHAARKGTGAGEIILGLKIISSMKRALFLICMVVFGLISPARADGGDDTLKFYLSKSDIVVLGTIVSEPIGIVDEVGVVNYVCDFKVSETLKGDVPAKDAVTRVTIVRFERDATDRHPLIKKGGECILFLKKTAGATPALQTADFWFGVQYPSNWMGSAVKRLVQKP